MKACICFVRRLARVSRAAGWMVLAVMSWSCALATDARGEDPSNVDQLETCADGALADQSKCKHHIYEDINDGIKYYIYEISSYIKREYSVEESEDLLSKLQESQKAWELSLSRECHLHAYIYAGATYGIVWTDCAIELARARAFSLARILRTLSM